ncbi:MAG: polysaccharide pyruvyl transferase family protein [Novosphingobium sp.]|nr:polysaccharide pyruvyl transferase family protein [Novosphingobium sp.]
MIRLPMPWPRPSRPDAAPPTDGIPHIHLIDTAIASENIGDEIIVDAARRHLAPILADCRVSSSSGHDGLGPAGRKLVASAQLVLLLGTNALASRYKVGRRFMWRVAPADVPLLAGKVVLFGVGANTPFDRVEGAQKAFLSRVLSPAYRHSVRDGRAQTIVEAAGHVALDTSCPTLWDCADGRYRPPARKTDTVCFTLTEHKPDPSDCLLIEILSEAYRRVVFFPQQARDLRYLREITDRTQIEILAPNLAAYDRFLSQTETDVVGTRLHGTIRGVQHGRRALVVQIDNRAEDIGKETGLPTISRNALPKLSEWIHGASEAQLRLPQEQIAAFLQQFPPAR